jgi:double zinc ribbon protein
MLELVAGVLLAAGLIVFVLTPVLRPGVPLDGPDGEAAGGWQEGEDPDDDLSPRAVALRALTEIEFDRATGKLSDADYEALKAKYTAEALTAMRAATRDAGSGMRDAAVPQTHPASRMPHPACPTHGPRPESDAQFCSECGRRLGSAPGYCARCGTSLEVAAQYCHSCGARVAA